MEEAYRNISRIYRNLTDELLNESIAIVESNIRAKAVHNAIKCMRDKAVIPFIESGAKSNFLSITPMNIHTKDDPILRYLPSIRNNQHSSIIWFEGAVFGTKPLDSNSIVDDMFVKYWTMRERKEEAIFYIKKRFGREFLGKNPKSTCSEIQKMETLFCSVCCLFDCGIHKAHSPKIINCKENPNACICRLKTNLNDEVKNISYFLADTKFRDILKLKLAPCVLSYLLQKRGNLNVSCRKLPVRPFIQKRGSLSKKKIDSKQFYEPCQEDGRCTKNTCSCQKAGVYCEAFCQCTSCSNLFYCSCIECDSSCPCLEQNRECTDLCRCDPAALYTCSNRPILNRVLKKVSICKSLKHGLGLFAEEFIPANDFVYEYVGELISDKEAERRGNFYEMNKLSYLFNCSFVGENCLFSVDSYFIGNKSRFINHSTKEANLKSEILFSHGNVKVVFYSLRDIFKGEEFLFDYQFTEAHKVKHGITD